MDDNVVADDDVGDDNDYGGVGDDDKDGVGFKTRAMTYLKNLSNCTTLGHDSHPPLVIRAAGQ